MEQILIVGDDSEVNEDNEMQHEEQLQDMADYLELKASSYLSSAKQL